MQTAHPRVTQSVDQLDDYIDCSMAIAALMCHEHDLGPTHRLHIATLLRKVTQVFSLVREASADDPERPVDYDQLQLCLEAIAALMDPATPIDDEARGMIYTLQRNLAEWQRFWLDAYTDSVYRYMQPKPEEAATAEAPRRTKKVARAA